MRPTSCQYWRSSFGKQARLMNAIFTSHASIMINCFVAIQEVFSKAIFHPSHSTSTVVPFTTLGANSSWGKPRDFSIKLEIKLIDYSLDITQSRQIENLNCWFIIRWKRWAPNRNSRSHTAPYRRSSYVSTVLGKRVKKWYQHHVSSMAGWCMCGCLALTCVYVEVLICVHVCVSVCVWMAWNCKWKQQN